MKQCEKCGSMMQDDSTFCMVCGTQVQGATEQTQVPQPMGQPQVLQAQPMEQPQVPKKNKAPKWLMPTLIGVAGLVVGIIATWGIMSLVNNNKSDNNNSGNNDEGGNTAVVDTDIKVSYAGYEFSVPKDYNYEIDESGLKFTSNGEYVATISYYDKGTFSSMKGKKEELAALLAQANSSVSGVPEVQTETVYGKECLVFGPFDYNNKYGFAVLISEAADLYCFQTNLIAKPGYEPLDYFDEVAKVVASAQKKTTSSKIISDDSDDSESVVTRLLSE